MDRLPLPATMAEGDEKKERNWEKKAKVDSIRHRANQKRPSCSATDHECGHSIQFTLPSTSLPSIVLFIASRPVVMQIL